MHMHSMCYLCHNSSFFPIFHENGIPIVRCRQCGHVFSTYIQEEHYEEYWDQGEGDELDTTWWDQAHCDVYSDFINKFINAPHGTLLDVGCGLGFFLKNVSERRPNWQIYGSEISEWAVLFARERNGLKNIVQGVVQKSGFSENSFDIITLWDVIEHIPHPRPLLQYLYKLLKPGGIFFIQTPNFPVQLFKARLRVLLGKADPNQYYLEAKNHINNYTIKTLLRLAYESEFKAGQFHVFRPILGIAGKTDGKSVFLKKAYFTIAKTLRHVSFGAVNINNTLFLSLSK